MFAGLLAPKEYDEILIEPASKPTKVTYKKQNVIVRELELKYEGATSNVEIVKVLK